MADDVSTGSRCALVTGAGRGIGASIASSLAARGFRVVVHSGRDLARGTDVVAGLPGAGHVAVAGDLRDGEIRERLFREAVDAVGDIDVLVNNAGVYQPHPVDGTSFAEWRAAWRDTIEINLLAAADLTWLFVDHLLHRGRGSARGRIVAVGSRGAYRGEPETAAYGASKAGLHAMTQSLAVALAPHGIVAAAVAPGFVETEMATSMLAGPAGDEIRAQSRHGRVARPDEVADVVTWLADAAPEWVSGTVIDVNGASYLR